MLKQEAYCVTPKQADCDRVNMYYETKLRPRVGNLLSLGARLSHLCFSLVKFQGRSQESGNPGEGLINGF